MKKLLIKTSLVTALLLLLVTACEKEPVMFDSSMRLIGFSGTTSTINENANAATPISLYLGAPPDAEATVITLSVDVTDLGESAAVEGTDFTISSKEVSVGVGETSVNISPVNNEVFTGNKKFYLVISSNSKNYTVSAQKRVLVTIVDDEHPIKSWIGSYVVAAASYGSPGSWDETWNVTTEAVDGDVTKLSITGIGNSTEAIIATLDGGELTISVEGGQSLGNPYGAGPTSVFLGTPYLTFDEDSPITGTLEEDGTILIDLWGHKITEGDYEGAWDVFNTTWSKQ